MTPFLISVVGVGPVVAVGTDLVYSAATEDRGRVAARAAADGRLRSGETACDGQYSGGVAGGCGHQVPAGRWRGCRPGGAACARRGARARGDPDAVPDLHRRGTSARHPSAGAGGSKERDGRRRGNRGRARGVHVGRQRRAAGPVPSCACSRSARHASSGPMSFMPRFSVSVTGLAHVVRRDRRLAACRDAPSRYRFPASASAPGSPRARPLGFFALGLASLLLITGWSLI